MDCRQNGLSDARWCEENDIQASTFYNWVTRLRKKECEIPASAGKEDFLLLPNEPLVESISTQSFSMPITESSTVLKLELNDAKLEIPNDVNPEIRQCENFSVNSDLL